MVDFFDHRRASVVLSATAAIRQGQPEYLSDQEHTDPSRLPLPRAWVSASEVDVRLGSWTESWLPSICDVTSSTNERTTIGCVLPRAAVGNNLPLYTVDSPSAREVAALVAALASFPLDYAARFKVGGLHLNFFLVNQFAVPSPSDVTPWLRFIVPRVLELTYTAADLDGFARDLGHDGAPFTWDFNRRTLIRAELDAAMFHLYGIERGDVAYVMDAFPIVRSRDQARFGEYRTKRLILECYDALIPADTGGLSYVSSVNPPPGDPAATRRENSLARAS